MLLPGARFVDLGPDGGPYDDMHNPKICWHTTEGTSLAGAEAAYRNYPPHLGYDPRIRDVRQYVRLDRHSYSLRGAESDDEYVIQIEVVGRAAETHAWPDEWYRNIGEDLIRPLRDLLEVPDVHLRFYHADEGIVLARATSPIRLSDAQLRTFSGHMGHQHAPAPDEHWDPGGFRIDKAIHYSQEDDMGGELVDAEVKFAGERLAAAGGGRLADYWLDAAIWSRRNNVLLNQLAAAVAEGDLDPDVLAARLDTAVREATTTAVVETILPEVQRIRAALEQDDTSEAKAFLDALAERLRPAA
ncbi:MAG TPA: hypothetical protein VGX25_03975 [Actinophytocola sp.]|uniref:hypothetical protein n=1 Tax=Actinophytocola sp. TaxID=1872138 RepID=UPI002DDD5F27|nr:hypothetical protein [Actinophytocola sp.]HEV2778536.1 hypothetical protein [Actinophytocola sp.]